MHTSVMHSDGDFKLRVRSRGTRRAFMHREAQREAWEQLADAASALRRVALRAANRRYRVHHGLSLKGA